MDQNAVTKDFTQGINWDVEMFSISSKGEEIAAVTNEDGANILYIINIETGNRRKVNAIPIAQIPSIQMVLKLLLLYLLRDLLETFLL